MNSVYNLSAQMTTNDLYAWAKQVFSQGQVYKRLVGNGTPENIVVLAVYRNWLSVQGEKDTHCIQLGSVLAREEEIYAQNEKGEWKLVHPSFQYSLKPASAFRRSTKAEQLELFAK